MHRIVANVTSLAQHLSLLVHDPDLYRPRACPHCGVGKLWRHGCYQRKVARDSCAHAARDPVAIPRFRCRSCRRTCSRLPACIAPRRWYDWVVQQALLHALAGGASLHAAARSGAVDRHTARRWRHWLAARGATFAFFLQSRFPDWGRVEDSAAFWRNSLGERSLPELMAWLDHDLIVP